jgi:hypothetical protein
MAIRKPAFITKQIRGGRPTTTRPYKWGPGVPSQAIEFQELPKQEDPFAQFQYLLTTEDGQILMSADGNYYLEPNRP